MIDNAEESPIILVVLAIVEHAGHFLLIEEAKEPVRNTWNVPGGRVEPGESLTEALVREVREEAGIEVVPRDLIHLDQLSSGTADEPSRLRFVFRATARTLRLKDTPDEHSLRAQWVNRSDLTSLTMRNAMVTQMIELAATAPGALPLSAIGFRRITTGS